MAANVPTAPWLASMVVRPRMHRRLRHNQSVPLAFRIAQPQISVAAAANTALDMDAHRKGLSIVGLAIAIQASSARRAATAYRREASTVVPPAAFIAIKDQSVRAMDASVCRLMRLTVVRIAVPRAIAAQMVVKPASRQEMLIVVVIRAQRARNVRVGVAYPKRPPIVVTASTATVADAHAPAKCVSRTSRLIVDTTYVARDSNAPRMIRVFQTTRSTVAAAIIVALE